MDDSQKLFIGLLAKADLSAAEFDKRETARGAGLATMRAELDEMVPAYDDDGKEIGQVSLRESIRSGMTFKVVDKKGKEHESSFHKDGQEHAIDTHGATAKGRGLSSKDQARVQKAMEAALKLVDKLRTQKGPDGKLLYTDADLMEEVFTPLMREGLLPDNLIIDKYSATNELLSATFGRYKTALKEAEAAKAKKRDENTVDIGGANGKLGTLKALGGKAGETMNRMQAKMMAKTGMSEDTLRRVKLGGGIAMSVKTFVSGHKSQLEGLIPDGLKNDMKEFLGPIEEHLKKAEELLNADLQKHAPALLKPVKSIEGAVNGLFEASGDSSSSSDAPKPSEFKKLLEEVQTSRAMEVLEHFGDQIKDKIQDQVELSQWLESAGDKLSDLAAHVKFKLEEIPLFEELETWVENHNKTFTDLCMSTLKTLPAVGKTVVEGIIDMKGVNDSITKTDHEREVQAAMREAVQQIDAALTEAMTAVDSVAGVAISGQYIKRTKVGDAVAAGIESPINGKGVITALAAGLEDTFAAATPPPTDPPDGTEEIFAKMGSAVASAFRGKANGDQLAAELKDKPVAALGAVVAAARAAAAKELGALGGTDAPTDGGAAAAFKQRVKDPSKQQALLAQGALPDPEEMEDEMKQSDEELKSYEDSLMLIDEGGFDAAQSRNIEVLIGELQKNRKTLELAAGLGQGLLGAGVKALKPIVDTGLGGHATDVLKLAKMIATLAVNIKKAADRWVLWYKFRSSLEHSKKAVSALTSTIQGFFNNKREQITFHTIDDALQAVQIAFTIVGMVPEPITMGIGKTVNLVAQGAQVANQIAGKVYNEAMLSKAWKTTLAAMNNPANRALGLAALRLNPTLGMHAVAWAGAERQPPDPIARMLMDRLGISAQTIAAGASGDQVKNYLVELLNEDRQIERSTGMNLEWMPPSFKLTAQDFFIVTNRASKLATPKLQLAGEKPVLNALKALDNHDLAALKTSADRGDIVPAVMTVQVEQARLVSQVLMDYSPRAADGTEQDEVANVVAEFQSLANAHVNRIEAIETLNDTVLNEAITNLKTMLGSADALASEMEKQVLTDWLSASGNMFNEMSVRSVFTSDADVKTMLDELDTARDKVRNRADSM